jgi:signal transduction histidine kinase
VCTLKEEQDSVFLRIADNGKGFLLNNQERKTLGLLGMRERVAMLNGQYQIESEPGKGTEVSVRIPLN